jgi:hypothetical protein
MTITEGPKITQDDFIPAISEQLEYNMYLLSDGKVILGGYQVPYIDVWKQDNFYSDRPEQVVYSVLVDDKWGFIFGSSQDAAAAIQLGANMAAIARGYSGFGPNMQPLDEFNKQPLGFLYSTLVESFVKHQGGNAGENGK